MGDLESRGFMGVLRDAHGERLGEARVWGMGERDGEWRGWLRAPQLSGKLAPGRYRIETVEGWSAEFELLPGRLARILDTDLLAIAGSGPTPWPPPEQPEPGVAARARLLGTPWQGAQGIPPLKHNGDYSKRRQ